MGRKGSQTLTPPQHLRYCGTVGHSAQTKADALDALRAGATPHQVHERTGIPRRTIAQWAKDAGIDPMPQARAKTAAAREAWSAIRAEVANDSGDIAGRVLTVVREALDAGELEVTSMREAKDAATVVGILVDKAQLLSGDATSRPELPAVRDHVLDAAKAEARHLRSVPA